MSDSRPAILGPDGKPATSSRKAKRTSSSGACPRCGASKSRRVPSAGFGEPHPVCSNCGFEDFPRSEW